MATGHGHEQQKMCVSLNSLCETLTAFGDWPNKEPVGLFRTGPIRSGPTKKTVGLIRPRLIKTGLVRKTRLA